MRNQSSPEKLEQNTENTQHNGTKHHCPEKREIFVEIIKKKRENSSEKGVNKISKIILIDTLTELDDLIYAGTKIIEPERETGETGDLSKNQDYWDHSTV